MPATPVFHFSAPPSPFERTLPDGSRPLCCRTPLSTPLCCNPHVTERLCKKGRCVACQSALSAPQARKLSQSGGGRQSGDNRDSAAANRTAASRCSDVFKAASARGKGPDAAWACSAPASAGAIQASARAALLVGRSAQWLAGCQLGRQLGIQRACPFSAGWLAIGLAASVVAALQLRLLLVLVVSIPARQTGSEAAKSGAQVSSQ